jgi:hypothetical protein
LLAQTRRSEDTAPYQFGLPHRIRQPSTGDHRQVMVRLTRRGKSVLEKLSDLHHTQLKTLGPELSRMLARLGKL